MNDTDQHATLRTEVCTERAHTAQSIAQEYKVKESTVRSWVSRWLSQVAPEALLKKGRGQYTELAYTLIQEFAVVDGKERPLWVVDAKERYAYEWGSAGVINCEVVPKEVGGTLALLSNNLQAQNLNLATQLAEADSLLTELNAADANFSQAEIDSWKASGAMKGAVRFKIETMTEAQTLAALRQRRLEGGQQS